MSYVDGHVFLAAEDALGLALGRRLLAEHRCLTIWRETNARGFGDLKADLAKYNGMAGAGHPVLMLTDLDTEKCCPALLAKWVGKKVRLNRNLLLRICQHEAETWLLAHPESLSDLLKVPLHAFPMRPESIVDPKAALLGLVGGSSKKMRDALLPAAGSLAKIGVDYNAILCEMVRTAWDLDAATKNSPSLNRARTRIAELASRVIASAPK